MKHEIVIKDPVLRTTVMFVVNATADEFVASMKRRGCKIDHPGQYSIGTVIEVGEYFFRAVWVQKLTRKDIGCLVHETFHLVTRICDDKGIPIVPNHPNGTVGDESAAYLMEFYINAVLDKLK